MSATTSSCDAILAAAITPNCSDPQMKGAEELGVIINRADVDFDSCVRDTTNPNIITTLALKSGKHGYKVYQQGNSPFTGTNTSFTEGTLINKFTKQAKFVIYDHSAACSHDIIDQLANGKFVMVIKNKYHGGDTKSKYEIYGYESGLTMTEGARDVYSEDTEGGWSIGLQEIALKSGMFMYNTDLQTTAAAFDSLYATQQ